MANETFTTRSGKQVPIVPFTLDGPMMVSVLRIKEDFAKRGEHLSTYGVVATILDKGLQATRNYWKNSAKQKENRDLGKVIQFMLSRKVPLPQIASFLEEKTGKKVVLENLAETESDETPEESDEVVFSESTEELTEEELEQATSPNSTK